MRFDKTNVQFHLSAELKERCERLGLDEAELNPIARRLFLEYIEAREEGLQVAPPPTVSRAEWIRLLRELALEISSGSLASPLSIELLDTLAKRLERGKP